MALVYTGAFVYLQWAREAAIGTAANVTSNGEDFGFEQKISSWSFTNNKIPLAQLNDIRVKTYAYGQTRGTLSLDFILSSPWFFEIIGFQRDPAENCGTGSDPYVHTYDLTSGTPKQIESFTVQVGQQSSGTDIVRTLAGGIVNSASISTTIGDTVKVSLDTTYINESMTTTLDSSLNPISVCNHIPFTFAHGVLQFDDACGVLTTISEVQDVDITFAQNGDHIFGIGNSRATTAIRRLFDISGKFRASYTDTVQLRKLYAQQKDTLANTGAGAEDLSTEAATLKLTFDNGAASTENRKIVITLTGISLADHNLNIEPNEPIYEELNFQARDATVVATNSTQAKPVAS
jgi:hypothetical protein